MSKTSKERISGIGEAQERDMVAGVLAIGGRIHADIGSNEPSRMIAAQQRSILHSPQQNLL